MRRGLEQRRERAYGDLGRQLESLNSVQVRMNAETTKLSTALGSTRTAGTWGEVQLRRVVELAGMTEHCDFTEQQVFSDDDGTSRPDLVVSLPGNIRIVVDAKAPTLMPVLPCKASTPPEFKVSVSRVPPGPIRP